MYFCTIDLVDFNERVQTDLSFALFCGFRVQYLEERKIIKKVKGRFNLTNLQKYNDSWGE